MDTKELKPKLKQFRDWLDKICLLAGIVCLVMIGLREIEVFKHLIRRYLCLFGGEDLVVWARTLYDQYLWKLFYLGLLAAVVLLILEHVSISMICRRKDRKLKVSDDELERRLFPYLDNTNTTRKCFVILGEWGTGKTYMLDQVLTKYMQYKFRPCYQISCFGLTKREEILDAIRSECRHQDTSMMKTLINWIHYLPAFGPWLSSVLEKNYELGDLRPDSIFVFEDFERIACSKEDREENYNLIVGFINEMIERYHYKTIIVCNNIEMESLYQELLHKKLDCEEYKIPSQSEEAYQIAKREIENDNRLTSDQKRHLMLVIEHEIGSLLTIFHMANMKNLRKLVRVFRAAAVFENNSVDWRTESAEQRIYNERCILYSALYREILEESGIDLASCYEGLKGRLFFDVYLDMRQRFGEKNDVIDSLLYAPKELVFVAFEAENMNYNIRYDMEMRIEAEKAEAESFKKWTEENSLAEEDIATFVSLKPEFLFALIKSTLYALNCGEKTRGLLDKGLETLGLIKILDIQKAGENILYEPIFVYLYDRRSIFDFEFRAYNLIVAAFLNIMTPVREQLTEKSKQYYQDLLEE